jgi:hypothetical protein
VNEDVGDSVPGPDDETVQVIPSVDANPLTEDSELEAVPPKIMLHVVGVQTIPSVSTSTAILDAPITFGVELPVIATETIFTEEEQYPPVQVSLQTCPEYVGVGRSATSTCTSPAKYSNFTGTSFLGKLK